MSETRTQPLAIVGMACVFPGAADLNAFWQNLRSGKDAISAVPPERWDPRFFAPGSKSADRVCCQRGGFIDAQATFDPLAFGIMPVAAEHAEPDQLLCLRVAAEALQDAGEDPQHLSTRRIGVILGRGGYLTPGLTRLVERVRVPEELVSVLGTLLPDLSAETLQRIKLSYQSRFEGIGPDTAIGLVPNLAASRIANRLDLHGPAYTLDAACASSLVALSQAAFELSSGRCDLVLAGGVHLCHDITFWSVFNQLGALSPSGQIRPLDRRADGLLIGEGVGLLALKRLADAEQAGNRIYAVVRGVGIGSDGRETSLMQPSVAGQLRVLRAAWEAAGLSPSDLGMLEAHGTGTPTGDATELSTLAQFFGPQGKGRSPVIGSVKSMIGHAMPASGAASLIKAALALYHGVRLPTLHCEEPSPRLQETCFRVIAQAEPWDEPERLAGVDAFGFGGIDAHAVLASPGPARPGRPTIASAPPPPPPPAVSPGPEAPPETLLTLSAATLEALRGELDRCLVSPALPAPENTDLPVRLCVLDPTPERLKQAQEILRRGRRWPGREGIFFTPAGLLANGGQLAFLFPGVDASFQPRVEDVAAHFHLPVPRFLQATDLEGMGLGIVGTSRLLHAALQRVGIRPGALAGHSIGEWTGMIEGEVIPREQADPFIESLKPGSLEVPGVAFAALGCGVEKAREAMGDLPDIAISHDNCPHQVLLCGAAASIEAAVGTLKAQGVMCQILPFRSGFHSPLFADYLSVHREHFQRFHLGPARVPLWSATTCAPYPASPEEIRALAIDHLIRPVRFRELIERLYQEGFRVFVQVGTGSLAGFVEDTLRGQPHLSLSANIPERGGLEQLRRVIAALVGEGAAVDFSTLWAHPRAESKAKPSAPRALKLGVPLGGIEAALSLKLQAEVTPPQDDPLLAELQGIHDEWRASERLVREALRAHEKRSPGRTRVERAPSPPASLTQRRTLSVHTVPALWDHCFFPQPPGWKNPSDGYPVVPMTLSIALMMEAAAQALPGKVVVAVTELRAFKWLVVEPPIEVTIEATALDPSRVRVEVVGYSESTMLLADAYPPAPAPNPRPIVGPHVPAMRPEQIYQDRWMFHGPQYHGIVELGPIGPNGLCGVLRTPSGPGSLLDNAGQLFGLWVMITNDLDRLAMPVQIERLDFFGPEPAQGSRVGCTVWIRRVGEREVLADLELVHQGRVWCRITGWEDRRFDCDPHVWKVMQSPQSRMLSDIRPGGYAFYDSARHRSPSRDWLGRRYLGQAERERMLRIGPKQTRHFLNGRIAAKDAIRHLLWEQGQGPIFPVEITLENTPDGAPLAHGPWAEDLRISLSHQGDVAVAIAAKGRDVGIDVERIEARPQSFESVAFSEAERRRIDEPPGAERAAWVTRFWCAKEAAAKKKRDGLAPTPARYQVTAVEGDRLRINEAWVRWAREGDYIVAWTEEP